MSAHVDLEQLAGTLADFTFAYLVTVNDDHRAHVVTVGPEFVGGVFEINAVGDRTSGNLAQRTDVTLIWPPHDPGGYTLLVDGRGEVKGTRLQVFPSRAVLHRPAEAGSAQAASGCLHDCVEI
ncbi:hypothetical protein BOO86_18495 [Mycobacterium sp. CBMA 234]|uniref:pyridoxamine 5'-phosphate oxidase family protein n=1 Tax=Mycolicibacterium sp. CBMA 234 TaxID=1918495 RepID=UPI0012DD44DB|nr:pyridoxamine 5'-phosphate oxidase family protein [Mycolicibacterium sp. CBMA 234]MUL66470.1 hypothetical protein [Mycolicibacterium sp. CBMA 234]